MALNVFRVNTKFDAETNTLALFTVDKTLYLRISKEDQKAAKEFFQYLSNKSRKIFVERPTSGTFTPKRISKRKAKSKDKNILY